MSVIQSNTVLLIGSAVSMFVPVAGGDGLPTGLAVVRKLLGELFPDWYGKDAALTKLVDKTPFEQLLEHYPHPAYLKTTFSTFFDTHAFNPIHAVLADEVQNGSVEAIVSTNYDRCVEGAFANKGLSFSMIATGDEDRSQFPIFKIHGTAEIEDTIVATLGTEYCLPDWKMELLGSLINGRHLVLLGYSGRDFDICPAIFSPLLRPLSITWVEPADDDQISINLRGAKQRGAASHVKQYFDEALWRPSIDKDPKFSRFKDVTVSKADPGLLIAPIMRACSLSELRRWRFRLLNALALARFMELELRAAQSDGSIPEAELHAWETDLAERNGRYTDSVQSLRRAISKTSDRTSAQSLELTLLGRLVTAHQTKRFLAGLAPATLKQFIRRHSDGQRADLYYLYGLLWKGFYRHPRLTPMRWLAWPCGLFALRLAAENFYRTGRWQNVFLCQVQAQDFGRQLNLKKVGAAHFFNLASDGFQHLNNYVGQISADRKHNRKRFADVHHVKEVIDDLDWLGLYPEIWKIAEQNYSAAWKVDKATASAVLIRAKSHLKSCQVSESMKDETMRTIDHHIVDLQVI
ncbi:hypothetical protein HF265_19010 [Rhizobium leguminosarum]|uniref:SIR2 family protein n=1 Tax=Rhizobium leguminosarum TaxID=384 RepID=UPI001C91EE40|nr:SIR2 family protein [Rhizobium leguminosarum]MBY3031154.1 hypothetical protein [Rhizobium leguminosarum]